MPRISGISPENLLANLLFVTHIQSPLKSIEDLLMPLVKAGIKSRR